MRKSNELLTDEDRQAMRAKLPKQSRDLLPRDVSTLRKQTQFYAEVAAAHHAEADMLLAEQEVRRARGEAATAEELRAREAILGRKVVVLEATCREKDEELMHLRSLPAQAVHS